ncbi:hypothetical protein [Desulfoscipio sp. XC116]|uniref:hypothetical protein n=1 Tax=Desulfoscipio sp. XC116 TaxID=3144975 RepID=UPI00325AA230
MYRQQKYETIPREEFAKLQLKRLQKTVQRVYDSVPYYDIVNHNRFSYPNAKGVKIN